MNLREYQHTGADFLYEHDRAMILAPVGAGKTALTLTAISDALRDKIATRVLVLAPKRVCSSVWAQEAALWSPHLRIAIALGTPSCRANAFRSNAQVVVTNYDNAQKLPSLLGFDCVVFDELTRLKNPSGKRFKAVAALISHINLRWGLTGSFTSNGLEDTFGQCKIVDQSLLGRSKGAFLQQYFVLLNPDYGEWAPRVGSLERVMVKVKPATFLLEPGEYTDTLPPLHTVVLRTDMDRKPYEKMKKDFRVEFPTAEAVAANSGVVTGKLKQMASGWVYDTTRTPNPDKPGKWIVTQTPVLFSEHKYELLDSVIEENQHANTIVAYWYVEELAELKRRYPHARTLDSENAISDWNTGNVELLLVHPRSAGHGLNLQFGGCRLIFLTLPWYSQELYEQTIGRLLRSGQKHDVWVYILLTNHTVDEIEWSALDNKRAFSQIANEALK